MSNTCRGTLNYSSCSVQWRIQNYSSVRMVKGEALTSPVFENGISPGNWWLELYPEGYSRATNGYISIFLRNRTAQCISISLELSLLNRNHEKQFVRRDVDKDFKMGTGWYDFVKKDTLFNRYSKLLDNDTLTVNLVLLEVGGTSAAVVENDSSPVLSDLLNVLNTSQMSDVEIRVGGKTFKAHKLILAARSSVFAAMFSHDMQENRTNVVNIVDTEPDVVEALLHYLYTGKCDHLEDMCYSILPLADKYCLEHLKKLCEPMLISQVNSENVILFLELADAYRLTDLKENCINRICDVGGTILESPEWKRLSTDNKDLAFEAMKAAFLKLSQSTDSL